MEPRDIAQRILAGDTSVIPGDSASYRLGWLRHADNFDELIESIEPLIQPRHEQTVLLGMGGSAACAGMLLEAHRIDSVSILDTSFPDVLYSQSFEGVNVVVSSKSGGTIETVCALAYALANGLEARDLTVITDPGTGLEELGTSLGATVIHGDRTTGGRFAALSVFGLVPALISGLRPRQLEEWPISDELWADAFERGFASIQSSSPIHTATLRDDPLTSWAAMWEEQLIAESTGKVGRGVIPLAGSRNDGESIQETHARVVGMCVALDVDPFNQPDVERAKQQTFAVLRESDVAIDSECESEQEALVILHQASRAPIAVEVFGSPNSEFANPLRRWRDRMHLRGDLAMAGFGPRYLHSTGQLLKGGPNGTTLVQVAVRPSTEPQRISGRSYSFHDLVAAQRIGDRRAMKALGRSVVSVSVDSAEQLDNFLSQIG